MQSHIRCPTHLSSWTHSVSYIYQGPGHTHSEHIRLFTDDYLIYHPTSTTVEHQTLQDDL